MVIRRALVAPLPLPILGSWWAGARLWGGSDHPLFATLGPLRGKVRYAVFLNRASLYLYVTTVSTVKEGFLNQFDSLRNFFVSRLFCDAVVISDLLECHPEQRAHEQGH